MDGGVERNRRLFDEWYRDIARINRIAAELHLGDRAVTPRIQDFHTADLRVWVARGRNHSPLSRKELVFVHVPEFAHDRILLSLLVSGPRKIDGLSIGEFGRIGGLQTAIDVIRIRNPLLADEPGAILIGSGRRLE